MPNNVDDKTVRFKEWTVKRKRDRKGVGSKEKEEREETKKGGA